MRVRLLGPVDVMDGGEILPVSGAGRAEHPEALPPDRGQGRAERVRDRVEDEVEAAVGKGAQVPHVAEHSRGQAVPVGHLHAEKIVVDSGYVVVLVHYRPPNPP